MYLKPPKKLPKEFLEIWKLLAKADDSALSRQTLAKRLKVSTQTIQRILVNGDVPDFYTEKKTRVINSWVKTLTRLALSFNHSPHQWIVQTGIQWNDNVKNISEREIDRYHQQSHSLSDMTVLPPARRLIGLSNSDPLSQNLPGFKRSFMETLARRVLSVLLPDQIFNFVKMSPEDLARELHHDNTQLMMGFGIQGSIPGIQTVEIPGLFTCLNAIVIHKRESQNKDDDMSEILSISGNGNCLFVIRKQNLILQFLTGQCGIPEDKILIRNDKNQLIETAIFSLSRDPNQKVVLIMEASDYFCFFSSLLKEEGYNREWFITIPDDSFHLMPVYSLKIGFSERFKHLVQGVQVIMEEEIFGATQNLTALMMAELAAVSQINRYLMNRCQTHQYPFAVTVELAETCLSSFNRIYQRHLDSVLEQMCEHYQIPKTVFLKQKGHYCLSCMADLRINENKGVSGEYCRFCADENGRLRSREDVKTILGKWLQSAQNDLSNEEALRRATLYMQAMPAWN